MDRRIEAVEAALAGAGTGSDVRAMIKTAFHAFIATETPGCACKMTPAPEPWMITIEAGDTVDGPFGKQVVLAEGLDSKGIPHVYFKNFAAVARRDDLRLVTKRPDKSGDGFVHREHPEWGIGVWHRIPGLATHGAYFLSPDLDELDRSKLTRVYAVGD